MYLSAFETLPCKDYQIDKIVHDINKQLITLQPKNISALDTPYFIGGIVHINSEFTDVPLFSHPLLVDTHQNKEYSHMKKPLGQTDFRAFVDVRNFTKINNEGMLVATSRIDYHSALLRAALSLVALKEGLGVLNNLTHLPLVIYTRWLTEQITRRLALTPDAQLAVSIITAYYYLSQFNEDIKDATVEFKIISQMTKALGLNPDLIAKTINPLKKMVGVQDYIAALGEHGLSIRLQQLNPSLLYGLLGGSWFGFNHKELTAVAVEHIPTFISLVYSATNEQGYRNTLLGRLVKENNRGDIAKFFTRSVDALTLVSI